MFKQMLEQKTFNQNFLLPTKPRNKERFHRAWLTNDLSPFRWWKKKLLSSPLPNPNKAITIKKKVIKNEETEHKKHHRESYSTQPTNE